MVCLALFCSRLELLHVTEGLSKSSEHIYSLSINSENKGSSDSIAPTPAVDGKANKKRKVADTPTSGGNGKHGVEPTTTPASPREKPDPKVAPKIERKGSVIDVLKNAEKLKANRFLAWHMRKRSTSRSPQ